MYLRGRAGITNSALFTIESAEYAGDPSGIRQDPDGGLSLFAGVGAGTHRPIRFWFGGNGSDQGMIMDEQGRLGIGISNPDSGLYLRGQAGINDSARFTIENADYAGDPAGIRQDPDGSLNLFAGVGAGVHRPIRFWFGGNGSDQGMVMDEQGWLGIGTPTPTSPLTVGSSTEGEVAIVSLTNDHGEVRLLVKGFLPSTETAPIGSLYIATNVGRLYINTDGESGWTLVGAQN